MKDEGQKSLIQQSADKLRILRVSLERATTKEKAAARLVDVIKIQLQLAECDLTNATTKSYSLTEKLKAEIELMESLLSTARHNPLDFE